MHSKREKRLSNKPINRVRQFIGVSAGLAIGLAVLLLFVMPGKEHLHVRGPMNKGHEDLECGSCHKPVDGSFRQQIQANMRYVLGMRQAPVPLGHHDVDNKACLDCHDRPNDRHPVFRFLEPRFAEARQNIKPQHCISCHLEHQGKLATIEPTFCVNCHSDMKVKRDPITTPHEELAQQGRWETCLGCHDFHGNHQYELQTALENAIPPQQIESYFNGTEDSPYPGQKIYLAKKEAP